MTMEPENDLEPPDSRQQELYFKELVNLKVNAAYIRRYRDVLSGRVRVFASLRALSSSGSVAAWIVWRDFSFVWSCIIAASQLADAMRDVFPFVAHQKSANALLADLDALFIDSLFEWEAIYYGRVLPHHITERRHKLMRIQHDLEQKHFPTGNLPQRTGLYALAKQDAIDYLEQLFGERSAE